MSKDATIAVVVDALRNLHGFVLTHDASKWAEAMDSAEAVLKDLPASAKALADKAKDGEFLFSSIGHILTTEGTMTKDTLVAAMAAAGWNYEHPKEGRHA